MTPAPPIDLVPESLDLKLYGGDGVELRLTVTNTIGDPIPLTGAINAQIRSTRSNNAALATFATDLTDGATGIVILSLTGDQTEALHGSITTPSEHFSGVWDVQWTPQGGQPVTIVMGAVDSQLDVTRLVPDPPVLDSISPTSILTTDPVTTVTCTGSNFGDMPTVQNSHNNGNSWASQSTISIDDTSCTASIMPPGSAETMLIRVHTASGDSGAKQLTVS